MVLAVAQGANPAGVDKRLDHVAGTTGFATAPDAPLHRVFGREAIADDYYAVTRAASAAEVVLPDSSIVSLGQNTLVQVGAFDAGAAAPGATIAIQGGTLRFDIRRPAGGISNYHFTTNTSQVAVRGTVGLISVLNGTTTVACLVCQADSVTIVANGQTIALANGQFVAITANGVAATGNVTDALLQTFQSNLVSTIADAGPAADTIAAGAVHAASVVPIVGAAAVLGAGIAISNSAPAAGNNAYVGPSAAPTSMPTLQPIIIPTPGPTATPTANAGVGIEAKRQRGAAR